MNHIAYFHPHAPLSYLCFGKGDVFETHCADDIEHLQDFLNTHQHKFMYGYIGYDAKNGIEKLKSDNEDHLGFPIYYFHVPNNVFEIEKDQYKQVQGKKSTKNQAFVGDFLRKIKTPNRIDIQPFQSRISYETYLETIQCLQKYIQRGDIYEINFCHEYFSQNNFHVDPLSLYATIDRATQAPFSCYLQHDNHYVFCGSPERFLQKIGTKLIAQPIKGTAPRAQTSIEDQRLKIALQNDPKEQSENVMIVDLLRNDLSKIARQGSVNVEELCGVYSFKTVHQLISTITCELSKKTTFTEILKATFPMGSMTGCPKVNALQLSEKHESFRRGLYSGTIGYFLPNGNFDFNVVIRTMLYNAKNGYLSCGVGGAITIDSDPQREYEECEIKIRKLIDSLKK